MQYIVNIEFKMKNKALTMLLALLSVAMFGQQWTNISNSNPSPITTTMISSAESEIIVTPTDKVFTPLMVIALAESDIIMLGESTTLVANASGGTGTYSYFWEPKETLSDPQAQTTQATPDALGSFIYTVTVNDGVNNASADVEITVVETIPTVCPTPENYHGVYYWEDHEFGTHLSWDRADYEFTLDRFEIYRSIDGVDFKMIKRIVNTPSISHYECFDIMEETGNFFYRIVAFYQNDCASEPLDILITVTETNDHDNHAVTLYPNPTTGKATVIAEQMRQIHIINSLGQTVESMKVDSDSITLDLTPFGKGLFLLMIQTENGMIRQSVIVK